MSKDGVQVEISEGLVKPIVEAKIRAAIVAEMSKDPQRLIDALVAEAMDYKVKANGERSRHDYENKHRWLSVQMGNAVRDAAKTAVREMIIENMPKIKAAIKAMLKKETGANKIAGAVMDGIITNLKSKYSSHLEISFETPKGEL